VDAFRRERGTEALVEGLRGFRPRGTEQARSVALGGIRSECGSAVAYETQLVAVRIGDRELSGAVRRVEERFDDSHVVL
jgi:hypothetical protein